MLVRTLPLLAFVVLLPFPSAAGLPADAAIMVNTWDGGSVGADCMGDSVLQLSCQAYVCTQSSTPRDIPITLGDSDSGVGLGIDPNMTRHGPPFGPFFGVFLSLDGHCKSGSQAPNPFT